MSDPTYQLQRQVADVHNLVAKVNQNIVLVNQQVALVSQNQDEARTELATLRQEFGIFARQAELTAALQIAEIKVGSLQDELEHEFGKHKAVRDTAVGMLQAFDTGMVSEETFRNTSEQAMLQIKAYWLAPILVALSAWAEDDAERCDRALLEAFKRKPSHTALFMALVLRRQGRHDSAARWLRHYLNAQDPSALGRDFAVILESIAQGAFGVSGLTLVRGVLDTWQSQLANNTAVQDAQVTWWRIEIELHRAASTTDHYPRLAQVSPQWQMLDAAITAAGAHRTILNIYSAMLAEEIPPNDRIEDAVDDILDRLVREYDNDELPLRRELALNRAIVATRGDVERAGLIVDPELAALGTTLDYLTIQTKSALNPESIGVSRSTQRIALASCQEWFSRAHAAYTMEYRMTVPADVEAVFEGSHNAGALAFSLPRWTGSFRQPIESLERSLSDHWSSHTKPYIDGLAVKVTGPAIGAAVATVAVLLIVTACSNIGVGLLLAALVGGISSLVLNNRVKAGHQAQERARDYFDKAARDSLGQLRAAGAELTDWTSEYCALDSVEKEVRMLIDGLATAGYAATPFQRRSAVDYQNAGA